MEKTDHLQILFQISKALVGKQDLGEVLSQIVALTADLIESKICALMLLDESKDKLVIQATQSLSMVYKHKPPVHAGQSISGRVLKGKEPIQVIDVTLDERYSHRSIAEQEGLKSLLSVPMLVGEKAIGVLNCYTENERIFSSQEIQLVQIIANQAAMSIAHTQIVVKEAEARLALDTRNVTDRAKRWLMKNESIDEESAHRWMQQMSMQKGKPLRVIAETVLLASELKLKL